VHEPAVQCIAKGKAGKPYEFGNKVSVAVSNRGGWFVGARNFTGSPYDGHTLAAQMSQVERMIGNSVGEVHVDNCLKRPQIKAEGENVATGGGKVAKNFEQFVRLLAQADHHTRVRHSRRA
jgi:hypothetical protein